MHRLKRQKVLPEKDAKAVFMQIMSGLRYLNRPLTYGSSSSSSSTSSDHDDHDDNHNNNNRNQHSKRKLSIIHFDLKPGKL